MSRAYVAIEVRSTHSVLHTVSQSLSIHNQVDKPCSVLSQLSEDDIFRDACKRIMFTEKCSLKQDFDSFFKRAFSERAAVHPVYTVPGNRRQDSSLSHHINQRRQMSVIYINFVRPQDGSELANQAHPGGLNAKNLQYFSNTVAGCPFIINTF